MPDPAPAPPGSDVERAIARARHFARVMDRLVGIPGSELGIGLDALLGFLFPVVGDAGTGLAGLYVVVQAIRAKVPAVVIARMLLNLGLDTAIGAIPIAGDIADVFFQANLSNLKLLEKHAGGGSSTTADWLVVAFTATFVLALIALPALLLFGFTAWLTRR